MAEQKDSGVEGFDLAEFDPIDEAQMVVKNPKSGQPTTPPWVWTFYGPSHPKTIELINEVSREAMRDERLKEEARVNGRKWKGDERSVNEVRERNLRRIVGRVKSWTPVLIEGETLTYSPEATLKLLLDYRRSWLFKQISDFLGDDETFMKPSASV